MATLEGDRPLFSDYSVDASKLTDAELDRAGREMEAASPMGYLCSLFEEAMNMREQQRGGYTLGERPHRQFAAKIRQVIHSFPIF